MFFSAFRTPVSSKCDPVDVAGRGPGLVAGDEGLCGLRVHSRAADPDPAGRPGGVVRGAAASERVPPLPAQCVSNILSSTVYHLVQLIPDLWLQPCVTTPRWAALSNPGGGAAAGVLQRPPEKTALSCRVVRG